MSHRIEIKGDAAAPWQEVGGAVVHLYGFRYRVIVTDGIPELLSTLGPRAFLRVNGIDAEEVEWARSPVDTASRGYVACEVTLRAGDEPSSSS